MDASLVSALIGGIGVIATAVSSYLVAKQSTKKDQAINDRQQLSKDEQQFRSEMWERIRSLEELVDKYHQRITELEDQLRESKVQYAELEIENKCLSTKVEELEGELRQLQHL